MQSAITRAANQAIAKSFSNHTVADMWDEFCNTKCAFGINQIIVGSESITHDEIAEIVEDNPAIDVARMLSVTGNTEVDANKLYEESYRRVFCRLAIKLADAWEAEKKVAA